MEWKEHIESMYPEMVEWRRHLHQNPELSFKEKNTSSFIADKLRSWGVEVRECVGGYGIIGTIDGSRPGPAVALRADMDALPIQDEKDCSYASKVSGVMHACGHDGHTSTLLAVAKIMSERRDRLTGRLIVIFQPAEELMPGGAKSMIEDGALDGVDVIYGIHLWSQFPTGTAWSRSGAMIAAPDELSIDITGKGGHAALPHRTVDSVVVASHLIVNLQSIVSRSIDPLASCVLSMGSIHGGSAFNVIAESCKLKGTVRTFDESVRSLAEKRIHQVAENTGKMFGAECRVEYNRGYPPVVNHESEVSRFFRVCGERFGKEHILETAPMMIGEDFAYYLQHIPGCFIFVGAGREEAHPHHHPRFDMEEEAMKQAAEIFITLTLDYMESSKSQTPS